MDWDTNAVVGPHVVAGRTVSETMSKLPVKTRFQVRTPLLPVVAVDEGQDSSDDVETDDPASDANEEHDEEKIASGYLADSEEEPKLVVRATRIISRVAAQELLDELEQLLINIALMKELTVHTKDNYLGERHVVMASLMPIFSKKEFIGL